MALSEDKRNEFAYKFLIIRFSDAKVGQLFVGLQQLCKESGISADNNKRFKLTILQSIEEYSINGSVTTPKDEFCQMAWKIAIHYMRHKEIYLNEKIMCDMGNCAKKNGVSTNEIVEFSGLLSQEVRNITSQ